MKEILNSFKNNVGFVRFQIESFNDFIDNRLQKIIDEIGEIKPEVPEIGELVIKFGKISIGKPCVKEAEGAVRDILPMEARIRDFSYTAPIYVEITPIVNKVEQEPVNVLLAELPIMIKSKICPLSKLSKEELEKVGEDPDDSGGYFIINGTERVLVLIEEIAQNRMIVEKQNIGNYTELIRINSERNGFIQRHTIERKNDGTIYISFANIRRLPIVVLLKLLGLEKDKDIVEGLKDERIINEFYVNLYETDVQTEKDALEYIGKHLKIIQKEYRKERVEQIIDKYLLPHLGQETKNRTDKANYLLKAIKKIIEFALGIIPEDDLDHYGNKRIKLSGDLLELLFRSILVGRWGLIARIKYNYQKMAKRGKLPPAQTIVEANVVTNQLASAMATGAWIGGRTGVSQRLERKNYVDSFSHMRLVLSPLTSTQEHFEARELHPTHWGKFCLKKDTQILLDDNFSTKTLDRLQTLWKNCSISTYDTNSNNLNKSRIINYFKLNPILQDKKVFKIIVESGREIIATEDHPFFTLDGWADTNRIYSGESVAIYAPFLDAIDDICIDKILVNEENIRKLFPKRFKYYIKELRKNGLLPLSTTNPKIEIIARLVGHLLTDGYCGNNLEFYCGSLEDAQAIKNDIKSIGFKTGKIREKKTKIIKNDITTYYKTFTFSKAGPLRALLIALGVPIGKKSDVNYCLPQWLFNVSLTAQREFLGAFLGGDGNKARCDLRKERKNSSKISISDIYFYKSENLKNSGIVLASDLKKLFENLSIKIKTVKTENGYIRKDGTKTIKIIIVIDKTLENLGRLLQRIGFRYCNSKAIISSYIAEWLRIRKIAVERRSGLKNVVNKLYENGMKPLEISSFLGIKYRAVNAWLFEKRYEKTRCAQSILLPFHEWIRIATQGLKLNGVVWEKIISKEPVELDDARDFTTQENTHTFIANGFVTHNCPSETPEGPTIGLRKHLALFAEITKGITDSEKKKFVSSLKLNKEGNDVYVDGVPIGYVENGDEFIEELKKRRKEGKISREINFVYYPQIKEVRINTDSGRIRRPLIILEHGKSKLTEEVIKKLKNNEIRWHDLIKESCIECLDTEEEDSALVALNEKSITSEHTYLELTPLSILGIPASLLPFPEHNRGDRVNLGAKMICQAIGLYQSNYPLRSDTKSNVLVYPQTPLVETDTTNVVGLNHHPAGQNVVVAITCYKGYNMLDGVVFNKSSIERGLFRSFFYRIYSAEEKRYWGGQEDKIGIPDKDVRGYRSEEEYANLAEDGILSLETPIESDSVLIGRTSPLRFLSANELMSGIANMRESSTCLRHGEKGIADRIFLTETSNGNKLVKVAVRDLRVPELGDKFASRHGQKSVIGLIELQENMPFTSSGMIPDIILNPHSVPSRQSIGQLLEILAGKTAALNGEKINAPAFSGMSENEIRKILLELGLRSDGKEVLYNGITGEKFEVEIFTGITYYQKLDHMVANKLQARSRGPVTLLTRQPTEGKAKEGGLRLGEMEKDCLIAHGAALTLKERFDSDKVEVPICKRCGLIAVWNKALEKNVCQICKDSDVVDVEMSYAFKLLLDELKTMLIYPKINVNGRLIGSIDFGLLSPQMIKKMSSVEMSKAELYDNDGFPLEGGVMDPKLGVIDPGLRCRTCGKSMGADFGHFGYIELIKPIIHVLYSKLIYKILKLTCRKCGRIISTSLTTTIKKCPHCGEEQKQIKFEKPYTFYENENMLTTVEIRERFERIPDEDLRDLGFYGGRPEWLLITLLPVPPVTMRPSITLETGERSEDDLTHKLVDIIRINQRLRENIEIGAPDFIIGDLWELLQYHVATFMDNSLSGIPAARHRSGRPLKTLADRLKSKEGRFRQNLTGKRVNFSARTVISPDPCISINEVGVPKIIAKELTIPLTVRNDNLEYVKELIMASPHWPSANYVIRPDGKRKKITEETKEEIIKDLAPGYVIERHLQNGDIVLFNRQPSLHRMSIMAHKVRVTPWKTFTINLCSCPPYNADFDGDEMNLHILQTEEAQAEAKLLMEVQKHIRSPRFGGPIVGCDQDHISGTYLLTKNSTVLNREDAFKILAESGIFVSLPEKKTFTGKEIFSFLLPKKLHIEFKAKVCGCEKCVKGTCENDGYVVIRNGKLERGVIDSKAVKSEDGKLIDIIEKEYGADVAHQFIDRVSTLAIKYLDKYGFTIGLDDIELKTETLNDITKIIEESEKEVEKLINLYKEGKIEILPGSDMKESLEAHVLKALSKVTEELENLIKNSFGENCATIMAKSGARSSMTHITQISAALGQSRIIGERIHRGYKNRTLSHFKAGDLSPAAHGFSKNSFKSGLNPFEFFFDAVSGRESLMDKSLRTRHSGYLERRLMNALQDLKIDCNYIIKDNRNIIIQFLPGEDKIDPAKSSWGELDVRSIVQSVLR